MFDLELYDKFVAGDVNALNCLIDKLSPALYLFAVRIVGNKEDASDIVQEVFTSLTKHKQRNGKINNIEAFLFKVCRDACNAHLRKTKRIAHKGEKLLESICDFSFDEELNRSDLVQDVHDKLSQLLPSYQELIKAYFLEGKSYKEMSENFGIPLGTVKSRLHTAMTALRECWNT